MHFTQLAGLVAFAGLTQAFLVPPSISSADIKVVEALPFEVEAIAEERVLEVDCPGCPVEAAKGLSSWNQAKSILRLNVTIEHASEQHDTLKLNGVQIMPVDARASLQGLFADQLVQAPDGTWAYASTPELGYSMSIKPYHDGRQDLSVFAVHLRIIEVANQFIRNIPAIDLKVIRTPSGKLMIADSHINSRPRPAATSVAGPKCTTMLCKWKTIVANKVDGLRKGCGSKKGGAHQIPRPYGIKGGRPKPEGFGRPHPHNRPAHPHGEYHHQRPHSHAVYRFLRGFTFHIILPVLVGMGIGITASVVGMLVGHFIVFVWRMLFRRGERGQCRNRRVEESDECDDETKGFLEGQGLPPLYEEVIVDEKTEQK